MNFIFSLIIFIIFLWALFHILIDIKNYFIENFKNFTTAEKYNNKISQIEKDILEIKEKLKEGIK